MLLHNYKMIDFTSFDFSSNLKLTYSDDIAIIPYLLMICDDIQEWNREKLLKNLNLNEDIKKYIKSIKLTNCKFE